MIVLFYRGNYITSKTFYNQPTKFFSDKSGFNKYVADDGRSKETFVKNTQAQDAIARRLEIIGKATKRLHEDFKEEYNQIPWKLMSGLRDVLIHEYDQIDLDQVWEVIQKDLPILKKQLRKILPK